MPPGEEFRQLMAEYRKFLGEWMNESEALLNAGTAMSVTVTERAGKGTGEGILGLTTQRFLFRLESPLSGFGGMGFPLHEVTRVHSKNLLLVPRMRELFIATNRDSVPHVENFYAGKAFVEEIEGQFRRL